MTNITPLRFPPEVRERLEKERQEAALAEAAQRMREVEEFAERFPPLSSMTPLPPISWEEVARQLEALAFNRATRSMVHPLLASLQAKAQWQPPEMVARGLILLTGLVMDETYVPADEAEPEPDDGGPPMP